jgi:hypothetical protein
MDLIRKCGCEQGSWAAISLDSEHCLRSERTTLMSSLRSVPMQCRHWPRRGLEGSD